MSPPTHRRIRHPRTIGKAAAIALTAELWGSRSAPPSHERVPLLTCDHGDDAQETA